MAMNQDSIFSYPSLSLQDERWQWYYILLGHSVTFQPQWKVLKLCDHLRPADITLHKIFSFANMCPEQIPFEQRLHIPKSSMVIVGKYKRKNHRNMDTFMQPTIMSKLDIDADQFEAFQQKIMPQMLAAHPEVPVYLCKDNKCGATFRSLKRLAKHCLTHLHIPVVISKEECAQVVSKSYEHLVPIGVQDGIADRESPCPDDEPNNEIPHLYDDVLDSISDMEKSYDSDYFEKGADDLFADNILDVNDIHKVIFGTEPLEDLGKAFVSLYVQPKHGDPEKDATKKIKRSCVISEESKKECKKPTISENIYVPKPKKSKRLEKLGNSKIKNKIENISPNNDDYEIQAIKEKVPALLEFGDEFHSFSQDHFDEFSISINSLINTLDNNNRVRKGNKKTVNGCRNKISYQFADTITNKAKENAYTNNLDAPEFSFGDVNAKSCAPLQNSVTQKAIKESRLLKNTVVTNNCTKSNLSRPKKCKRRESRRSKTKWRPSTRAANSCLIGNKFDEFSIIYAKMGNYLCSKCPCQFISQGRLDKHTSDFHKITHVRKSINEIQCKYFVSCEYCGMIMLNRNAWRKHLMKQHLYSDIVFNCAKCNLSFTKKQHLADHYFQRHKLDIDNGCSDEAVFLHLTNQKCEICNASYFEECVFEVHKQRVNALNQYRCSECPLEFSNLLQLTHHFDENHLYKCNICNMEFRGLNEFRNHQCDETYLGAALDGERHICNTCDKQFDTLDGKLKHMVMKHTNLCTCFQCEEELYSYSEMASHVRRLHKDDFPGYFCGVCNSGVGASVFDFLLHLTEEHEIPSGMLR